MDTGLDLITKINSWQVEQLPLSKEPFVSEMGKRLVPIVQALLERISKLETRMSELEAVPIVRN
tara:strand:+ start:2601 stop:2792 length:192 start_codon:yes stop_codon:yes gene_type:complete